MKMTPFKAFLCVLLFGFGGVAHASLIGESAGFLNTWDQISNKYFYAALALWPVMFMGIARMRRGERLTPAMSKATAFSMYAVNSVCILFLVVHFAPETSTIFDWIAGFIKRVF